MQKFDESSEELLGETFEEGVARLEQESTEHVQKALDSLDIELCEQKPRSAPPPRRRFVRDNFEPPKVHEWGDFPHFCVKGTTIKHPSATLNKVRGRVRNGVMNTLASEIQARLRRKPPPQRFEPEARPPMQWAQPPPRGQFFQPQMPPQYQWPPMFAGSGPPMQYMRQGPR